MLVSTTVVAGLVAALLADSAIRGQSYAVRALVVVLTFGAVFNSAVVVAESLLQRGQLSRRKARRMSEPVPDKCPCNREISPDPPGPDGTLTWTCECLRFGYLLWDDYLSQHPEETRVQVCGFKRIRRTAVVPIAA
ncbi:hypothetical protein [Kitasatospora sp. NPDC093558]|uniref:hypothetical protein n=1 Tax=Kitasatospora sp. NPDC093558 TaxID=3155201 RepID=UPI003424B9FE